VKLLTPIRVSKLRYGSIKCRSFILYFSFFFYLASKLIHLLKNILEIFPKQKKTKRVPDLFVRVQVLLNYYLC